MACGRTLGHGEACVVGHECGSCMTITKLNNALIKISDMTDDELITKARKTARLARTC